MDEVHFFGKLFTFPDFVQLDCSDPPSKFKKKKKNVKEVKTPRVKGQ